MFDVLLAFLAKTEGIVSAKNNLFGAEHFSDASDYGFIGGSRRIVKELAKVMTRFVLAFSLTKSSLDSPCQKRNGSADVGRNDFEVWILVEETSQRES